MRQCLKKLLGFCIFLSVSVVTADEHKPRRVYADIVGDMLHIGHVNFFKKARAYEPIPLNSLYELSDNFRSKSND